MPTCKAVTVTVPAVEVLVTRQAAIGWVRTAIALVEPDTSDEKIVGPALDWNVEIGSSIVTSICQLDVRPDVRTPKPIFIGAVTCQFVSFQGLEPDDVTVT